MRREHRGGQGERGLRTRSGDYCVERSESQAGVVYTVGLIVSRDFELINKLYSSILLFGK
jgi:hypothetical protein